MSSEITLTTDFGRSVCVTPNEFADIGFTRTLPSVICDGSPIRYRSHWIDATFDERSLIALARYELPPADVLSLRLVYGDDAFEVHGDFYDEAGNALQPMSSR